LESAITPLLDLFIETSRELAASHRWWHNLVDSH